MVSNWVGFLLALIALGLLELEVGLQALLARRFYPGVSWESRPSRLRAIWLIISDSRIRALEMFRRQRRPR